MAPGEEGGEGQAGGGQGHQRLLAAATAASQAAGREPRGRWRDRDVYPRPGGYRPAVHGEAAEAEGAAQGVARPAAEREGSGEGETKAGA